MSIRWLIVVGIVVAVGCGSPIESDSNSEWELTENSETANDDDIDTDDVSDDDTDDDVSDNNTDDNDVSDNNDTDDDHCLASTPLNHRPAASRCDRERGPGSEPYPDYGGPVNCETDDDCVDGDNGRCTGNGHDGWYCTYDACFGDDDCGAGSVCECEGGFRSDNNVCLAGNCQTDDDCSTGFCSPSLGTCGNYTGAVGYFCRTCEDECVNDSDCAGTDDDPWGAPYCMYDEGLGHWRCSDSHCVG